MKRERSKVVAVLVLFLVATLAISCQDKSFRDKIEGRWRITSFVIENPDELHPEMVGETTEIAESVQYRFNRDFSYDIRSKMDTESSKGTWKYNPQNQQLILRMQEQDKTVSTVTWVDDDELILNSEMGQIGKVKLTLKKMDQ